MVNFSDLLKSSKIEPHEQSDNLEKKTLTIYVTSKQ